MMISNGDMVVQRKAYGGVSWNYLPGVVIGTKTYLDDFKKYLLPLVRPEWKTKKLATKMFDAGITNALFAIFDSEKGLKGSYDDVVLIRVNGKGTDDIVNRTDELVIFCSLHLNELSPPVYAQLENGLCYGYIAGRHLSPEEFSDPHLMKHTSRVLAEIHNVQIPPSFSGREPLVTFKTDEWLKTLPSSFKDPSKEKCFRTNIGSVEMLQKEFEEIKREIIKCQSPIVFCHNDTLCGNFIYSVERDRMKLIDFEYAGPNYLAYDIANHFCEFAGIENVDYSKYPNESLQKVWLTNYLKVAASLKGNDPSTVTEAAVHALFREVNKFALSSHLFWTVWALLQALNSTIDFNYVEYAGIRFKEYKQRKHEFLSL